MSMTAHSTSLMKYFAIFFDTQIKRKFKRKRKRNGGSNQGALGSAERPRCGGGRATAAPRRRLRRGRGVAATAAVAAMFLSAHMIN